MEFEKVKEIFQNIYGKEISTEEFLTNLKIVIDDIDLLVDEAKATRELVKNILRRVEKSVVNKKVCNISKEKRKIAIKLLTKLGKILSDNEYKKRFVEALSELAQKSLDKM